jgi:hypothetical protein
VPRVVVLGILVDDWVHVLPHDLCACSGAHLRRISISGARPSIVEIRREGTAVIPARLGGLT